MLFGYERVLYYKRTVEQKEIYLSNLKLTNYNNGTYFGPR